MVRSFTICEHKNLRVNLLHYCGPWHSTCLISVTLNYHSHIQRHLLILNLAISIWLTGWRVTKHSILSFSDLRKKVEKAPRSLPQMNGSDHELLFHKKALCNSLRVCSVVSLIIPPNYAVVQKDTYMWWRCSSWFFTIECGGYSVSKADSLVRCSVLLHLALLLGTITNLNRHAWIVKFAG